MKRWAQKVPGRHQTLLFTVSGSGKLTGTVVGNGDSDTLNYAAIDSSLAWTISETGAGTLRHAQ